MHFTSLAVNGLPSCQVTPWRSLKMSERLSLLHSQLVANSGVMVAHTVLRLVLVVDDQIVEERHGRDVDRKCRLLVDREAGRRLAVIDLQDAAMLGFGGLCNRERRQRLM